MSGSSCRRQKLVWWQVSKLANFLLLANSISGHTECRQSLTKMKKTILSFIDQYIKKGKGIMLIRITALKNVKGSFLKFERKGQRTWISEGGINTFWGIWFSPSVPARVLQWKNLAENKNKNKTFRLHPCGKIYVYPIGRCPKPCSQLQSQLLNTLGQEGVNRKSHEHHSRTIKTPCSPVFSKPNKIQFFSQVKTTKHRQKIDA